MKQKIIGLTLAFFVLFLTAVAILFTVKVQRYLTTSLWAKLSEQTFLVFKNEQDEAQFNQVSWTNFQAETTKKEDKKAFRLYKKKISLEQLENENQQQLFQAVNLSINVKQGWYNITILLPSKALFETVF